MAPPQKKAPSAVQPAGQQPAVDPSGPPTDPAKDDKGPTDGPTQGGPAHVVNTQKLPKSQFHQAHGRAQVPPIDLKALEMPKTHVTPEYCLEEMGRVLQTLAEQQEDPTWVDAHLKIADLWRAAAETLLNHAVQSQGMVGDTHLKQQEVDHNEDMHQQQLAHADQQHFQGMKQQDDQHQQSLKQNDEMHQKKLQQTDEQHSQRMKQQDDHHKVSLDVTKKQGDFKIKVAQDREKDRKAQAAKKQTAAPKPAPKKSV